MSAGEIFAYVTALEYAYDQSPKAMKVVVQAIGLLVGGMGSACAMALTAVARNPYLVTFYASLTGSMAATTLLFWVLFRGRDGSSVYVEDAADASTTSSGLTQQVDSQPAVCRLPNEPPLLDPIDTGSPIELYSGNFYKTVITQPQGRTDSLKPLLPRKSSRRQRTGEKNTDFVSRVAPSTCVIGTHDQLKPRPGHQLPSQSVAGPVTVLGNLDHRPLGSYSRRYYDLRTKASV